MHFCKIFSVPEPVTYVFLQGPKTSTLGPLLPWSKKNRDWRKKVTNFLYALLQWLLLINHWVLSPYLGTTKTGLLRAFRNGMAIGKSPLGLQGQIFEQHILQAYKCKSRFFKILNLWTTLMEFLVSEGMSEGTWPFSSKIFDKKNWPISTSGECTFCLINNFLFDHISLVPLYERWIFFHTWLELVHAYQC